MNGWSHYACFRSNTESAARAAWDLLGPGGTAPSSPRGGCDLVEGEVAHRRRLLGHGMLPASRQLLDALGDLIVQLGDREIAVPVQVARRVAHRVEDRLGERP